MRVLRKLGAFIMLIFLGAIVAGVFGSLHDQLSYTIAPEYFTRFKFVQFAWAGVASMPPRLGAAVVGALATWWVGVYAGVILGLVALRRPSALEMFRATGRAFGLVALISLAIGIVGLAIGFLVFDPAREYMDWWRPMGLVSPRLFFAVGMMHNGSYLGGAIGVVIAATRLWRRDGTLVAGTRASMPTPAS